MPIPSRASDRSSAAPPALSPEVHSPLRLTVARGKLGLELYESVALGPLQVTRLGVALPGLKFPIDLSGGVRLFRNRRGLLERLELTLPLGDLAKWMDRRLRQALGGLVRPVAVWPVEQGLGIGLVGIAGAVAFDVLWAPADTDARFVVAHARGADLNAPALGCAIQILDTAFGKFVHRSGRILVVPNVAKRIARAAMPSVGARAPAASRLFCSELRFEREAAMLVADSAFSPPAMSESSISALELGELVREADDALGRGDLDNAREGYVTALERAPRHPEISCLVAEIDATHGGRIEAALALLSESVPPMQAGAVGATLLSRIGATDSAAEALRAAAEREVYAPVTALLFCALSELEPEMPAKERTLDTAVASCPGLASVRLARFEARVRAGQLGGALADAEHLEASASGSRAKHEILRRTAERFLDFGYVGEAGRLFERALRYVPDDAGACAGLGRALLAAGNAARAVPLFERAIALGDELGVPEHSALVDLATVLAAQGDLPQAIARVRRVGSPSKEAVRARALEGQWRESLGDLAGATLAYARMRETIELSSDTDTVLAVGFLRAAAHFELTVQDDPPAAERHLSLALRLLPRDKQVAEAYREAAAAVQERARRGRR